jgi:DNA-binding NarL/FixJ family response regulator
LRALLDSDPQFKVLSEMSHGSETVTATRRHRPDVVILALGSMTQARIDVTKQILRALAEVPVLIIALECGRACKKDLLAAGVRGCVGQSCSGPEFLAAVRKVHAGSQVFAKASCHGVRRLRDNLGSSLLRLTLREREVVRLVAEGNANKQVAGQMGISAETVRKHRQHLMDKLNIHNTAGLTRFALASGLVRSVA